MINATSISVAFCLYLFVFLCYLVYRTFGGYHYNPFIRLKELSPKEKALLAEAFPIYHKLPQQLKERCNSRIVWFRSRKKFVFHGTIEKQEDVKLLLSASAVFMLLGLKDFKMMRSVLRIIIYPSNYYSRINKKHHLGEYNPGLKAIVFAADTILEGFRIPNDNINLAVHEFAHALCHEMTKKSSWQARKFKVGLKKIKLLFNQEEFQEKLADSTYFREYGMTNLQEFFSVAVENYVETPEIFSKDFPKLYGIIQRMLNFDFHQSPITVPPKRLL